MTWFRKLPMALKLASFFALIALSFVVARIFAATVLGKGGELFGRGDAIFFLSAWGICVVAYYGFALLRRLLDKRRE
jgi:hypothetical protein